MKKVAHASSYVKIVKKTYIQHIIWDENAVPLTRANAVPLTRATLFH